MRKFIYRSGILIPSLALFVVAGLILSSCGDSDEEAEPEVMEMQEFFLSVNAQGEIDCRSGNANVRLTGDESTGKLGITITSVDLEGLESDFQYSGIKFIGGSEKTIVTSYLGTDTATGDYNTPGVSYLTSTTNDEIRQGDSPAVMFAGFWSGPPSRFGDIVALCPHVLTPRDAVDTSGMPITCGGADGAEMSEGLRDYLGPESGEGLLGTCYKTLDGARLMVPMAVQ